MAQGWHNRICASCRESRCKEAKCPGLPKVVPLANPPPPPQLGIGPTRTRPHALSLSLIALFKSTPDSRGCLALIEPSSARAESVVRPWESVSEWSRFPGGGGGASLGRWRDLKAPMDVAPNGRASGRRRKRLTLSGQARERARGRASKGANEGLEMCTARLRGGMPTPRSTSPDAPTHGRKLVHL